MHSPLGTASITVGDDAAASDVAKLFKLAREPVLVNVPAEVTDEEVLNSLITCLLSLGLLYSRLSVGFSLALLRGSLLLVALAGRRVRVI